MRLYSCKVRLDGSLYNEVPKFNVSAAEIHLLRIIHGADAVVGIEETTKNKVGQAQERDRLLQEYGPGLVAQQLGKTPEQALNAVFGVAGRLPDDIPGAPKAKPKTAEPVVAEPDPADLDDTPEEDPEK